MDAFEPPVAVDPGLFQLQACDLSSLLDWVVTGLKSHDSRILHTEKRECVSPDQLSDAIGELAKPPQDGWASMSDVRAMEQTLADRISKLEQAPAGIDEGRVAALEAKIRELETAPRAPSPAALPPAPQPAPAPDASNDFVPPPPLAAVDDDALRRLEADLLSQKAEVLFVEKMSSG